MVSPSLASLTPGITLMVLGGIGKVHWPLEVMLVLVGVGV